MEQPWHRSLITRCSPRLRNPYSSLTLMILRASAYSKRTHQFLKIIRIGYGASGITSQAASTSTRFLLQRQPGGVLQLVEHKSLSISTGKVGDKQNKHFLSIYGFTDLPSISMDSKHIHILCLLRSPRGSDAVFLSLLCS